MLKVDKSMESLCLYCSLWKYFDLLLEFLLLTLNRWMFLGSTFLMPVVNFDLKTWTANQDANKNSQSNSKKDSFIKKDFAQAKVKQKYSGQYTCRLPPALTIAMIIFSVAMKGNSCITWRFITEGYTTNPSHIFWSVFSNPSAVRNDSDIHNLLKFENLNFFHTINPFMVNVPIFYPLETKGLLVFPGSIKWKHPEMG